MASWRGGIPGPARGGDASRGIMRTPVPEFINPGMGAPGSRIGRQNSDQGAGLGSSIMKSFPANGVKVIERGTLTHEEESNSMVTTAFAINNDNDEDSQLRSNTLMLDPTGSTRGQLMFAKPHPVYDRPKGRVLGPQSGTISALSLTQLNWYLRTEAGRRRYRGRDCYDLMRDWTFAGVELNDHANRPNTRTWVTAKKAEIFGQCFHDPTASITEASVLYLILTKRCLEETGGGDIKSESAALPNTLDTETGTGFMDMRDDGDDDGDTKSGLPSASASSTATSDKPQELFRMLYKYYDARCHTAEQHKWKGMDREYWVYVPYVSNDGSPPDTKLYMNDEVKGQLIRIGRLHHFEEYPAYSKAMFAKLAKEATFPQVNNTNWIKSLLSLPKLQVFIDLK